jgi:hypothetical protein
MGAGFADGARSPLHECCAAIEIEEVPVLVHFGERTPEARHGCSTFDGRTAPDPVLRDASRTHERLVVEAMDSSMTSPPR